ncbi:MAG: rhomboid family intramembrane serine protease [Candidatus Eremiobacteraeota bacterium]|nr:rhomboid family intramembrane serine protease [Candidatus Eremiobacteraeota bacterium]
MRAAGGFPWVVCGLVALNVWVFVQEAYAPHPDRFIDAFAMIPYDITHDVVLPPPSPPFPPLTIITSMFVHGGVSHIVFNLLFLFVCGPAVENVCGHLRFLAFYLICGIVGGVAVVAVASDSQVPTIGASGAIAGVMGAYLVEFPFAPVFLRLPAIVVIGLWAAAQFLSGFDTVSARAAESQGGVAYFAHIGGFSAGVLLIGLMVKKKRKTALW